MSGALATAIVVLGASALPVARRIQAVLPNSKVLGLQGRAQAADVIYSSFGDTLRALYRDGTGIVALCAAGIVIRTLASVLDEKGSEPPVLAVAEDGSAVVPLLGGLGGVNALARQIADMLDVAPAITTSGELRFGTCLLDPPEGYVLADLEQGKHFVSDVLAGQHVRVEGDAPWLAAIELPRANDAALAIRITPRQVQAPGDLVIHPRSVIARVETAGGDVAARVTAATNEAGLAPAALACLLAPRGLMGAGVLASAAEALGAELRFIPEGAAESAFDQLPSIIQAGEQGVTLAISPFPVCADDVGQRRGRLAVVGLGPGERAFMVPAVQEELARAEDVLGYETYVNMAGPFRPDQVLHRTDNREELQRARHALELAASGRNVVVVSSGDPGVFAMASAVLEALEAGSDEAWHSVDLAILPGVSACLATAALSGAPLGHDFCVISLSDNLKPWSVIEERLDLAGRADLAMAFYNPISRSRPWQLGQALDVVRRHRAPDTPVVLGRDVARPGQRLTVVTLGALTPEMVDMRTMVIVGSSTTRTVARSDGTPWVYTPRWYPQPISREGVQP
ncbi:precorrin-3B C(17)-methyltransferase [Pseudomonas sp. Marseille-Q5115]|uniref:precorrin-3B C(17)-methyltransferase n=1 Tax=Pseudomonas sp. Marseille-Q5115 TaxID=2866593 RepID=UPI001CE4009D|nr:precorrin-3B C(17)-methyltransferase [Pseudomonas sp. Marseille-Q5115]